MLELLMMEPPALHDARRVLDAEHDAADQQLHAVIELLLGDGVEFTGGCRRRRC